MMRVHVDLRQLEAFVAIATYGNFSIAASQLHVSQPALSRTIRLAEETLGARLFDRDTRRVQLTPAGAELLPTAQRIVGEFDDSMSELSQFIEGRRGRIKVSALPSMSQGLLTQAVAAFNAEHPDIQFYVRADTAQALLAAIESGEVDVGITAQPPPDGRFDYRHLIDDEYVLICRAGHPLAQQAQPSKAIPWRVFEEHRYIAGAPGSSVRFAMDGVFMRLGMVVRPAHETTSLPVVGALVAAGLGISAVPRSAIDLLAQASVVTRRLGSPRVERRIGLVTRRGRTLSAATRRFCECLEDSIGGRPEFVA